MKTRKIASTDTDDGSSWGGGSVWKFSDCFNFLKIGHELKMKMGKVILEV